MSTQISEMDALKTRLRATWMSGDYGYFAKYLEPGALEFLARLRLKPGDRMLDVGCGAGQLSIPAARAGIIVTGVDIATNLLDQARKRAAVEHLTAQFDEGDAEQLPYADGAFDCVVSLIAAMFAPRPEMVAAELIRVCKPGGRIAMGNWTSRGFVGEMFRVNAKHVPPPAIMPAPVKWGDEQTVRERFRHGVKDLRLTPRMYQFKYPFPPADVVAFYRTYYGPTLRAFAALDADGQEALRSDLVDLWTGINRASDGTTEYESEYLEVTATRA